MEVMNSAFDKLSIIWTSDLSDKTIQDFFQAAAVLVLLYGYTTWTKSVEKKAWWDIHRNVTRYFETNPESSTPQNSDLPQNSSK